MHFTGGEDFTFGEYELVKKESQSCKKAVNKNDVSDSIFTNDELIIIRTDILKLYDTTDMDEWEVHKRNLMLNKIREVIGG